MNVHETPPGGWRLTVQGKQITSYDITRLVVIAQANGMQGKVKELRELIIRETMPFVPHEGIYGVIRDDAVIEWDKNLYLLLGRYGDIIQLLPILHAESVRLGRPVPLLVAKEFAGILEGCGYVQPVIWEGDWKKTAEAERWASRKFNGYRVVNCSVHSADTHIAPKGLSFDRDIWINAKSLYQPHTLPLNFDRRNAAREKKLVSKRPAKGRVALLSLSAHSSPFYGASRLKKELSAMCPEVHFEDISEVKAERLHDLLGYYDICDVLIATDSAPLHLAGASDIKTVALVTDQNTAWHQSSWKPHHTLRVPYSKAEKRIADIASLCNGTYEEPRILFVKSAPEPRDGAEGHRLNRAKRSIPKSWIEIPFTAKRDASSMGDRPVPYIRDMIEAAMREARPNDIVVILNADICTLDAATGEIVDVVTNCDSGYACRWDFSKIERLALNENELSYGTKYPGADLFAFSVGWWNKFGHDFPDMLLGREGWDMVMRDMMRYSGGVELHRIIYHEAHASDWLKDRNRAGNKYNVALANKWLEAHGTRWN